MTSHDMNLKACRATNNKQAGFWPMGHEMNSLAVRTVLGAACIGLALSGSPVLAQGAGPFNGLEGNWAGTGTVELADGSSERVRCRANYKVGGGGKALEQGLRCASDSYRIDLSSELQSQGGTIVGKWSESNRNIFGSVQGRAAPGQISVFVEAAGFAANLSVATKGAKQSIEITSKGEIRNVSITMSKG